MRKIISIVLSFGLLFQQGGLLYAAGQLNLANYLSQARNAIVQPDVFQPARLRYISYDIKSNDFKLLLDKGGAKLNKLSNSQTPKLNNATQELFNYFLIGLSLPNDTFWVNLRPDASENIIDPLLEKTDIGKIFLEADLQLKKDTASLTSPQNPEGKAYWDKLYKKAGELFGTENITIPTITRPWIVPNEVIVRETDDSAYIYKATLKVMLEQDHLKDSVAYNFSDPRLKELNEYSSQIIRETIIPKLTKEINSSKRYAQLRQVYYSLVLARWFKQKYSSQGSISAPEHQSAGVSANSYLSLIDSGNLANLASSEPCDKQAYFQAYQKSFKDGEYNLKETVATPFGQSIRSYISGGIMTKGMKISIVGSPVREDVTKALKMGLVGGPSLISTASPMMGIALSQYWDHNWRLVRCGNLSESVKASLYKSAQNSLPDINLPEFSNNDMFVVELNESGGIKRVLGAWIKGMENSILLSKDARGYSGIKTTIMDILEDFKRGHPFPEPWENYRARRVLEHIKKEFKEFLNSKEEDGYLDESTVNRIIEHYESKDSLFKIFSITDMRGISGTLKILCDVLKVKKMFEDEKYWRMMTEAAEKYENYLKSAGSSLTVEKAQGIVRKWHGLTALFMRDVKLDEKDKEIMAYYYDQSDIVSAMYKMWWMSSYKWTMGLSDVEDLSKADILLSKMDIVREFADDFYSAIPAISGMSERVLSLIDHKDIGDFLYECINILKKEAKNNPLILPRGSSVEDYEKMTSRLRESLVKMYRKEVAKIIYSVRFSMKTIRDVENLLRNNYVSLAIANLKDIVGDKVASLAGEVVDLKDNPLFARLSDMEEKLSNLPPVAGSPLEVKQVVKALKEIHRGLKDINAIVIYLSQPEHGYNSNIQGVSNLLGQAMSVLHKKINYLGQMRTERISIEDISYFSELRNDLDGIQSAINKFVEISSGENNSRNINDSIENKFKNLSEGIVKVLKQVEKLNKELQVSAGSPIGEELSGVFGENGEPLRYISTEDLIKGGKLESLRSAVAQMTFFADEASKVDKNRRFAVEIDPQGKITVWGILIYNEETQAVSRIILPNGLSDLKLTEEKNKNLSDALIQAWKEEVRINTTYAGSPVVGKKLMVYDENTAKNVELRYVTYKELAIFNKEMIKERLQAEVFGSKINMDGKEYGNRREPISHSFPVVSDKMLEGIHFAVKIEGDKLKSIKGIVYNDGKEIIFYGETAYIAKAILDVWKKEGGVSSAVVLGQVHQKPGQWGGIDLTDRALHIKLERVGSFASTPLLLPQVKNVQDLDLDKEFEQVEALASSGIVPNSHRLLELFTVCHYRGEFGERLNQIISCLKAASAIQEAEAIDSDEDFRLALMMPEMLS